MCYYQHIQMIARNIAPKNDDIYKFVHEEFFVKSDAASAVYGEE